MKFSVFKSVEESWDWLSYMSQCFICARPGRNSSGDEKSQFQRHTHYRLWKCVTLGKWVILLCRLFICKIWLRSANFPGLIGIVYLAHPKVSGHPYYVTSKFIITIKKKKKVKMQNGIKYYLVKCYETHQRFSNVLGSLLSQVFLHGALKLK